MHAHVPSLDHAHSWIQTPGRVVRVAAARVDAFESVRTCVSGAQHGSSCTRRTRAPLVGPACRTNAQAKVHACLQTDAVLRRVNALFTHRHCVSWLINIACICSLSDVQPSEINMVYAATNSSAVLKSRSLMAPAAVTRYAIHSAIICACEKRKVIGFTCRCTIAKMAPVRVSALPTRS